MNRILKLPVTNAVCLCLFTSFYTVVFIFTAQSDKWKLLLGSKSPEAAFLPSLTRRWGDFLASGYHVYVALAMLAVTFFVAFLLIKKKKPYDEYHISILVNCLIVSLVLSLIAVAGIYVLILYDTTAIIEKMTFIIVINWVSVVFSDLIFVLCCKTR